MKVMNNNNNKSQPNTGYHHRCAGQVLGRGLLIIVTPVVRASRHKQGHHAILLLCPVMTVLKEEKPLVGSCRVKAGMDEREEGGGGGRRGNERQAGEY